MGAKQKLETLTNTWYGFAVFSAAIGLFAKGLGVWSIFTSVIGLLFSFAWVWFWGNRLQNKSNLARWVLMLASGVLTCGFAVSTAKMSWMFVHAWEIKLIIGAGWSAVQAWILAKSFRTLTDSSVKIYFNN